MFEEQPKARTGIFRFNTKIKYPKPCTCRYCHPELHCEGMPGEQQIEATNLAGGTETI
jgi:hypothetical protein